MAVFTAIGAAVAGAFGLAAGTIAFTVVSTIVAVGSSMIVSRLINGSPDRGAGADGAAAANQGTRIQLPPGTSNRVPVLYGKAFVNPIITDAYISDDNKKMTYVLALSETVNLAAASYRIDNIYWNDLRLEFDGTTTVKRGKKRVGTDSVAEDYTDDNYKDLITFHVYRWDPVTQTVVPVSGRAGDSAAYANAVAYASSPLASVLPAGVTISDYDMQGFVFAIMTMAYNSDKGLTGLGTMTFEMSNNATNPAVALIDYMTSERYGGAVDPTEIDYASFMTWADYADTTAPWTPIDGGATQYSPRYRINGLVDTSKSVKQNIDSILLNAGAWMAYDVQKGQWRVIVKKAEASPAWLFSDDNIVSGITLSSSSLTDLYNIGEIEFYDSKSKDQRAYRKIYLRDENPALLNYNEPDNILNMQLEFCNENIQAERILNMELEQSRDDLVVQFSTSHYGLQVQAGDVIGVSTGVYGWTGESFPQGKFFRVVRIKEIETDEGALGAEITALEYNAQVYDDKNISEFYPRENIGIFDSNNNTALPPPTLEVIGRNNNASTPNVTIRVTAPAGTQVGQMTGIEIFAAEGDDFSGQGADAVFRAQVVGSTLTASGFPPTDIAQQLWLNINGQSGYSSELYAVGLAADTKITAYGTGNGGNGTYSVNNAQTLSVRNFRSTVNRAKFTGTINGDVLTVNTVTFGSGNIGGISLVNEECVFEGYIAGTTLTVTTVIKGTLAVNQTLQGQTTTGTIANILAGTKIIALGTGTGGTGNYTINTAQTIGSVNDKLLITGDRLLPNTTILAQLTGATGAAGTYKLNKIQTTAVSNLPMTMKYPYPQLTAYQKVQEIRPVDSNVISRNEQREVAITGLTANATNKKYFLRARTFTTNSAGANVYGPFSELGEVDLEAPTFFWDPDNSKLKEQVLNMKQAILKLDFGKVVLPNNGYWVMKTMTSIDFGDLESPSPYQLDLGLTSVVENEVDIDVDFESFVWQTDPPNS